jgi:hypothetical protein
MTEEKRNLFDELKEGVQHLTEQRIMTRDQLIKDYAQIIDDLRAENAKLQSIITKTLYEIPVGYIPDHTPEKLSELVKFWVKDAVEGYNEVEELEEENETLRQGFVKVAANLGNGSAVSAEASLNFLAEELPLEVKLVCSSYRAQINYLERKLHEQTK